MPIDPGHFDPQGNLPQLVGTLNALNENKLFPLRRQQIELENRGLNIANTTNQAALNTAYFQRAQQIISSMPNASDDEVTRALTRGANVGAYPPDFLANFLGGNPVAGPGTDLQAIRKSSLLSAGNANEMEAAYGTPSNINTGGATKGIVTNRVTGTQTALGGDAAVIPNTLTPGEKATGVQTFDTTTNAPTRTTVGALSTDTGEPRGGPVQTGPALGQVAGADMSAQAQVTRAVALQDRASMVPERKAGLENLRSLAPDFAAGPQSGFWKGLGQFAAQFGINVPIKNISANATASQEEFDKVAIQILAAQRQQMGLPTTDASTALTTGAVPNDKLSPKGIQRVAGLMEGNEDYIAAKNQARLEWQRANHNNGETHGDFESQFNRMLDPRVFQSQYMSPDQKAKVRSAVGAARFDAEEAVAKRHGWLGGP